ncbi:hypothetical protein GCM10007301_09180 [Azorhizobium oxalatiphilum]|uniref:DUF6129 domain-containing protein n=1 Tax=Azorhizobium oxalatiphilum TaxID=980631 RepID=A0A917F679_9HYPH|nr:DUF6129 family protein [Azorhizobium oxalatiphilum]GGF51911.1 hypothetical protein GCM10007301_09180 [Azorhizobium oxalatiphilum]
MALAASELADIEALLNGAEAGGAGVIATLRGRFPHLSWTRCDASDVAETPFRTFAACDLHLLDGHDHCVQLTNDPARATGLVLAMRQVGP